MVTITDVQGNTISWSSSGVMGFKGSRKSTPYAWSSAAPSASRSALLFVRSRWSWDRPPCDAHGYSVAGGGPANRPTD